VAADVGVSAGRIAFVEPRPTAHHSATRTIDGTGLIVAPGFVDVHTHYDAQIFWDAACTPSSLHGVTTVLCGNCGFSIAPLLDESDYMMRLLSRVEGIPLDALAAGVPWSWRSFGDYLAAIEASWAATHVDGDGNPVPSRAASPDELLALCSELAGFDGTQVEFIATNGPFEDRKLSASDFARQHGAHVVGLSYPDVIRSRISFLSSAFDSVPDWAPTMALPPSEKLAALADHAADAAAWEVRRQTRSDPRVVIGASDGGAHLDMLTTFDYPVRYLALARQHQLCRSRPWFAKSPTFLPGSTVCAIADGSSPVTGPTSSCSTRTRSTPDRWSGAPTFLQVPGACTASQWESPT
jgi:hypothetical protein